MVTSFWNGPYLEKNHLSNFFFSRRKKIKKVAEKLGAKVPFIRQKKLSDSKTGLIEVFLDSVKKLNINEEYTNYI